MEEKDSATSSRFYQLELEMNFAPRFAGNLSPTKKKKKKKEGRRKEEFLANKTLSIYPFIRVLSKISYRRNK